MLETVKKYKCYFETADDRIVISPGNQIPRDFIREAGVQFPLYVGSPSLMKQFELPGIPALITPYVMAEPVEK